MRRNAETIEIPIIEYNLLKEIYKIYKRQRFLFRIDEAERNLRDGNVKSISADEFIRRI